MLDQDKILNFLKVNGPVLPSKVAKNIKTDILLASAMLSDLASQGKIKISKLKVGGSPLYYLPGQESQLYAFASGNINPKDHMVLDKLKANKILREDDLDLLGKVALRSLKDFAIPLHVIVQGHKELFWKWHLLSDEETTLLIRSILYGSEEEHKPQPTQRHEEPRHEEKTTLPAQKVLTEDTVPQTADAPKTTYALQTNEEPELSAENPEPIANEPEPVSGMEVPEPTHKSELVHEPVPEPVHETIAGKVSTETEKIPAKVEKEKRPEDVEKNDAPKMSDGITAEKKIVNKTEKQKDEITATEKSFKELIKSEKKEKESKREEKTVPAKVQEPVDKKAKTRKKRSSVNDEFVLVLEKYFHDNKVMIQEKEIVRKNSEIDMLVKVPSVVGEVTYFCKAKNKVRCDEKDISSAYMEAQIKKLPLLFLYKKEINKKAKEMLDSGAFQNVILKKFE